MAGLIFLWQNSPSVVININYGLSPVLDSIRSDTLVMESIDSPVITLNIDTLSPNITIQLSDNVFTDTDNTWSDSDIAWSDSSAVWGGVDPKGADRPTFDRMDNVRPQFIKVGK